MLSAIFFELQSNIPLCNGEVAVVEGALTPEQLFSPLFSLDGESVDCMCSLKLIILLEVLACFSVPLIIKYFFFIFSSEVNVTLST